jgi:hypothetical protein
MLVPPTAVCARAPGLKYTVRGHYGELSTAASTNMPAHEQLLCVLHRVFYVEVVVAEGRTSHSRLGTGACFRRRMWAWAGVAQGLRDQDGHQLIDR